MDDQTSLLQRLQAYGEARAALAPLLDDVSLLALLHAAAQGGVLAAARRPQTPAGLAATLGLDEARLAALCNALEAYGVLVREGDAFCLEARWAALADPELPFPLVYTVDYALATAQVLQGALAADTYWTVPPEMRLALARGVTVDPAVPLSPRLFQVLMPAVSPELDAQLNTGCDFLELGSGVGGDILSLLAAYPRLKAVGVELAADLVREAEQTAARLGLQDRVQFLNGDARAFDGAGAFDVVYWSQFFFPTPARAATLQAARRALRAGALLIAPAFAEPPAAGAGPQTDERRDFAITRIVYGAWDIPLTGSEALQREIASAGFANVQVVQTPINRVVLARRPRD